MAKKKEQQGHKCENCGKKLKWYKFPLCPVCVRRLHKTLWGR